MSDTITITVEEYEKLQFDSKFLSALESAGVDNWDGYEVAQEQMEEGDGE